MIVKVKSNVLPLSLKEKQKKFEGKIESFNDDDNISKYKPILLIKIEPSYYW